MNPSVTVSVDSSKAIARFSGPLVLGDTYAISFSGLSTAEAAANPQVIVLGAMPGRIATRTDSNGELAMTTEECVMAFKMPPPPPIRPREFPQPPALPNPPVHGADHPHGSVRLHFYVTVTGATIAQGDLVFLWAPYEYSGSGTPIQLKGDKGDKGNKGDKGDKGDPGRNGVYVAMDGLYAFHISQGGDHPEDGHLWIHAQDDSTLYAHNSTGGFLLDDQGNKIPLYYIDGRGHLLYRFFYEDSTHTELDLGRVVTHEGLYAFHVSDGSDGEPEGHLMLHGQNLAQIYATDANGDLILDENDNPIPLFKLDANGHLIYTFYGEDGEVHATLDIGDVRGTALTWDDLTAEQKASLKGDTGATGAQGPAGPALTFDDLTDEQKAALKGDKGDPGEDGMTEEQIREIVSDAMGNADDAPTGGSSNWVTSGGLWTMEQALIARILDLAAKIANIRAGIAGAYHYKGTVDTVEELPATGNEEGDVWNVRKDETHEDGMNYAWTGEAWDALGVSVDLSAYALKSEVSAALAEAKSYTDTHHQDLSGYLQTASLDAALEALGSGSSWFYQNVYSVANSASADAYQASLDAADAKSDAADAKSDAADALSTASGLATSVGAIEDVMPGTASVSNPLATVGDIPDVMSASLPQGVSGTNLGSWVSTTNTFLGTLPSPSDILSQNSSGNVYKGVSDSNVLTTPPKINGDQLALARSVAAEYNGGSFVAGDYCTHDGKLYRCTASTSGSFDSTKWTEVSVATAKLDANKRNLLDYTSGTTLAPETAVYRSSLNADGTFPTITDTAIPTAAAYYQFELELAVPSTVPSTITGPSGWTWLDGHGLPDPADLSGGETICISVRLDCTSRTFLASVWRVA